MHQTMLFFTKKGRCYWLKCYEIPDGDRNSKGRAIQNMLNIEPDDSVNACRNGQRNDIMQKFPNEGKAKDNQKLKKVSHFAAFSEKPREDSIF